MVHVKVDTKQNLCASRTQSPSSIQYSTNPSAMATTIQSPNRSHNVSYASPILNKTPTTGVQIDSKDNNVGIVSSTNGPSVQPPSQLPPPPPPPALPARNLLSKFATSTFASENTNTTSSTSNSGVVSELLTNRENGTDENSNNSTTTFVSTNTNLTTIIPNTSNSNNDELITFTSSSLIEKILSRLRWRRERTKHDDVEICSNNNNNNNNNAGDDSLSIFSKSNRRGAVSLLRGTGWFGSGKSTNSSTGLFAKDHQLNGITCDDGGKVFFYFFFRFFFYNFCVEIPLFFFII